MGPVTKRKILIIHGIIIILGVSFKVLRSIQKSRLKLVSVNFSNNLRRLFHLRRVVNMNEYCRVKSINKHKLHLEADMYKYIRMCLTISRSFATFCR